MLLFSAPVMVINVIGVKWFGQVEYAAYIDDQGSAAIVAFYRHRPRDPAFSLTQPTACIILPMAVGLCRLGSSGTWFATIVSIFSYLVLK